MRLPKFSTLPKLNLSLLVLLFFVGLAVIVTYPIAFRLSDFSVLHLYTDDLLEAWTLEWNVHALLAGPAGLANIWQANIFYPYPLALAFSEHLLSTSVLLLPVSLWGATPLTSINLGVLLTTVLSGWGMYLLVRWIGGGHWGGLAAGVFFAIAPYRLSHITQLHLISTHWIPFILLAAARLAKYNRRTDFLLLVIFTNLQFLASVNYAPLVAMMLAIWFVGAWFWFRPQGIKLLLGRLALFGGITVALNLPVLLLYQRVSHQMGIVRTLGDAAIYGASWINYILPIGNSLLYGRWLHLPTQLDDIFPGVGVFVSTFPGLVVVLLAVVGSVWWRASRISGPLLTAIIAIIGAGIGLSFGANEMALGAALAPLTAHLLPYRYLYEIIPLLQGLRVPLRFALLPTVGLAMLAGLGLSGLVSRFKRGNWLASFVILLTVLEHLPAPLPGVSVPAGADVYDWLATRPPQSVVIELPYYLHTGKSNREVYREYQSTRHWQRLVNGASGFEPDRLVELGRVLDGFPDAASLDLLRRLQVDYVILHRAEYSAETWTNLTGLLPGYLSAISAIHTVGDDWVLQLAPPTCPSDSAGVLVDATAFPTLTLTNTTPAAFVADPRRPSYVSTEAGRSDFLELLFILPGQTITTTVPLETHQPTAGWQLDLANLNRTLSSAGPVASGAPAPVSLSESRPLEVAFANGVVLQRMALSSTPQPCGHLALELAWSLPASEASAAPLRVNLALLDRFDRLVIQAEHPLPVGSEQPTVVSRHLFPLAETVPAGQYRLQVQVLTATGQPVPAVDHTGAPVTTALTQSLLIRPAPVDLPPSLPEPVPFANGLHWLGVSPLPAQARPGGWLHFSLYWQAEKNIPANYTIFTQLLGPDGQVWGQHDNPPRGGWYPISLWATDEVVVDDYALRLDPAAPAGKYRLLVGWYNPADGQRLLLEGGRDFIEAGRLTVVTR